MRATVRHILHLSCSIMLAVPVPAQQKHAPSASEIVTRVERGQEGINDYTVTLDVVADLDRLSVPPMHATMYYKKPDKVQFESKKFLLLPREGMIYNPSALHARYTVLEPAVKDTLHGEMVYKITLEPKGDKRRMVRLYALVNPLRWTLEKVMSEPSEGRTMSGDFRFVQVDRWWLPAELTVRFALAQEDSAESGMPVPGPVQRPQMPRTGSVTIRYSDYRVNSGLSDDIFAPPEERK